MNEPGQPASAVAPPADGAPSARVGARRVPAPWWWTLAVLVVVGGALIGLAQPAGSIRADVSEHFDLVTHTDGLTSAEPQEFRLTATDDGLSGVSALLGTFGGAIDCRLTVQVVLAGRTVDSEQVDCSKLPDSQVYQIASFAPQAGSAGEPVTVRLGVTDGSASGPVVWLSKDNQPSLVTVYGKDLPFVDRLGTVIDRIEEYGPAWATGLGLGALGLVAVGSIIVLAARPRWGLVAVIVLVLARGLLWSALIPPLQGMDEGAHFANAQYIAVEHALPNPNNPPRLGPYSDSLAVLTEAMHVNDQAPTDRPDYGAAAQDQLAAADQVADPRADGTGAAASYPPLYYAVSAVFYQTAPDDTAAQVHAMRVWSVLLGVLAMVFSWLFVGELAVGPRARAGIVTAVALQPMLAQQFAIVNNDGWVIAWGAAALWVAMRMMREPRAARWMLLGGVVVGLTALGKPFGAVAAFPIAFAWLLSRWRLRVRSVRTLALDLAAAAAGVLATYGTWLATSRVLGLNPGLGFPVSNTPGPRGLLTYLSTQIDPHFLEFRGLWVSQFWGDFGWVNTPLPQIFYSLVWWTYLALAALLLGWVVVMVVQRHTRDAVAVGRDDRIVVLLLGGLAALAAMYGIEFLYFRSVGRTDLLQGRYLLLMVPALVAVPVLVVQRLWHRWHASVAWLIAAGVAVLHLAGIVVVIRHYYL